MFSKSKTKIVTTKTTNKYTQVQTVVASSYSQSNGFTEVRNTGSKSVTSNGSSRKITSVERFGTSVDALQGNPFETEFGNKSKNQSLNVQSKIDAKMLSAPNQYTSSYSQIRIEPGGYRSPYRNTARSLFPTSTNSALNEASSSYSSSTRHPVSSFAGTNVASPNKTTSIISLKPIKPTTLSLPNRTAVPATRNEPPKTQALKKTPKVGPGDVYIFNHEKFDNDEDTRIGTKKDVEKLIETFRGCFKMSTKVFQDLRVKDIETEVAKIQKQDYSKKACIIIVILTHGTRNDVVCAKDNYYSIDDMFLFKMLQNKTLSDKPKIFIVQACKGDNATHQYVYKDAKSPTLYAPLEIAKLYSTFEGFVSYRGNSGSLFIQVLCQNLQKDGKTKSVIQIMENTISQILKGYKSQQVPTILHNMTNPLIFGEYV